MTNKIPAKNPGQIGNVIPVDNFGDTVIVGYNTKDKTGVVRVQDIIDECSGGGGTGYPEMTESEVNETITALGSL